MTPLTESMLPISVRTVDYANPQEAAALVDLMDGYARDVAGGGKPLEAEVKQGLVQALRQRQPQAFSVMAWMEEEGQHSSLNAGVAVGLVNCFEGVLHFCLQALGQRARCGGGASLARLPDCTAHAAEGRNLGPGAGCLQAHAGGPVGQSSGNPGL